MNTNKPSGNNRFWMFFVFGIPLVSIVSGITLVTIATKNADDVVHDDWYKEGKAINRNIERQAKAEAMQLSATLTVDTISAEIIVELNQSVDTHHLLLELTHPTDADRDQTLTLNALSASRFRGDLERSLTGRRYLSILPIDSSWELRREIQLPLDTPMEITP